MLIALIVIVALVVFGGMLTNATFLFLMLWSSKVGRVALGCLAAGLVWLAFVIGGGSSSSSQASADQAQIAAVQAQTQRDVVKAEANPLYQKALVYTAPAYDKERASVCAHFRLHPDVIAARSEVTGPEAHIELIVRPGLTDRQLLPLAHRVRVYLSARFKGDRSLIVQEVNIHHPLGVEGVDDNEGVVGAIVCNGQEETETTLDPVYHVLQDQKMIE